MLHFRTSDDNDVYVDENTVVLGSTIQNLLQDCGPREEAIPLPTISSPVLNKVLEWSIYHRKEGMTEEIAAKFKPGHRLAEIGDWDRAYITLDEEMLLEVIAAADYLALKPLLHVGMMAYAGFLEPKTFPEIREMLHIVNPFPPELEAKIRAENEWAERK